MAEPLGRPPINDGPAWDIKQSVEGSETRYRLDPIRASWQRFFNAVYAHILLIIPAQPGGLKVYANNAAARAAGLQPGEFYRSGGDPDIMYVVH